MHEMVAAYHPDAKLDFSRTLPDFPTTDVKEAMTAWIESARGTFTDVRLEPTASSTLVIPWWLACALPARVASAE